MRAVLAMLFRSRSVKSGRLEQAIRLRCSRAVEAFAQAGVEVEQWGVAVDQEHGVVCGGFGAGGEAAGW